VQLFAQMNHPHIVRYYCSTTSTSKITLMSPSADDGEGDGDDVADKKVRGTPPRECPKKSKGRRRTGTREARSKGASRFLWRG